MNTYLTLLLDGRRIKKDGTFPIIIRLTHLRKTTSIATGFSVEQKDWNERKSQIKNNYTGVSSVNHLNTLLLKELARANEIINKLFDRGELYYLSIYEIKQKIIRKTNYESFFEFGQSLVDDLMKAERIGTARTYLFTLSRVKKFNNGKDLKFNQLNFDFLKRFERNHLSKGNSLNGLSTYTRSIRAIYNKAIRAGIIDNEVSPFYRYQIKKTPTAKRALDIIYIKKILELNLDRDTNIFNYRNYFLLSYMLCGMSFVDMAHLKFKNIVDGRIEFDRKKTGRNHNIKITGQIKEILKIYLEGKSDNDFIFPIITRKQPELAYKDIEWARGRYNKGLKVIANLCGIEQRLTSYVSRHSFATQAMLKNIPLEAISAMMGHSKLNTTQIYLKSLPNNILDDYNEKLIAAL